MSDTAHNYAWNGPPELVAAAIAGQADVLGPRPLDGVAYVAIRTADTLTRPEGLADTGPELSRAILGGWMDLTPLENPA